VNARLAQALLVTGTVALAGPAAADETTYCNNYIRTLPYTITVQGHYCFNKNLSTAITDGAAITIEVDYVVLDLNNFKLGGGAAGLGTQAVGVRAVDRKNVTIRNGNIRGFYQGILLGQTVEGGSAANVIENNLLDGNTHNGLRADGTGIIVRGNTVLNTGGSTVEYTTWSGIVSLYGRPVVRDNVVDGFVPGAGESRGIHLGSAGLSVAERNVVMFDAFDPSHVALVADVCRDNTVAYGSLACGYFAGDNVQY
jgi:hypothetical protein